MEYSPMPLNEQERSGLGRDCPFSRIVALLQNGLPLEDIYRYENKNASIESNEV